nr:putative F-box protein At4g38870 [Ipomoea trifida]
MSAPKKTVGVSTLPQEILMEILYKLPAKSLVRFRPNGVVAVCNVSTRQRIFLPRLNQYRGCILLLWYDSRSKRYKVFMLAQMVDQESSLRSKLTYFEYKHWALTLGVDRSWREINNYYSCPFFTIDGYPHRYILFQY